MRAPALLPIACLVAFAAGACEESKSGLRVSIETGTAKDAKALQIVIGAKPGGFKEAIPTNMIGARVTTEDFDGDGLVDLVANFNGPFPATLSFRVNTGNRETLSIHAAATA